MQSKTPTEALSARSSAKTSPYHRWSPSEIGRASPIPADIIRADYENFTKRDNSTEGHRDKSPHTVASARDDYCPITREPLTRTSFASSSPYHRWSPSEIGRASPIPQDALDEEYNAYKGPYSSSSPTTGAAGGRKKNIVRSYLRRF